MVFLASYFYYFSFFQSVKVGGQGMERRACMTQLIRMARFVHTDFKIKMDSV